MANRIFRGKQEEYWDIWCEHAIVFPKEMPIKKAFTGLSVKPTYRFSVGGM